MKFQFEGYIYSDDKDYIEIDFDFMEKSEFIRVLEPDLMVPIMIPERFEKYQIDEFKVILEKITNKEELTDEDRYLCKTKVLMPLLEYFRMDREVMDMVGFQSSIKITMDEEDELGARVIEINIKSGTYSGRILSRMVENEDGKYELEHYDLYERKKINFNFEELIRLKDNIKENKNYLLEFPYVNDIAECCENVIFVSRKGKLFYVVDINALENEIEIMNPINFLDSFYTQLKNLEKIAGDE